jgi:hypothetical protein
MLSVLSTHFVTEYRLSDFLARFGPWAVVTGASSGIGEAFAPQLAMHLKCTLTCEMHRILPLFSF